MEYKNLPDDYLKLIYDAMGKVGQQYCRIASADNDEEIFRERVYCYELYHQMRTLQKANETTPVYGKSVQSPLIVINGEIDKSGHRVISQNFNPDFVIHLQGSMDKNICVVEVKNNFSKSGIAKDFGTITCMMNCYRYGYGLFVFVGDEVGKVKETIRNIFDNARRNKCVKLEENRYNDIIVFLSRTAACAPEAYTLQEILSEEHKNVHSNLH